MADFIKDGLNACPDGFFFDRLFCLLMSLKLIVNPPDILWLPVDKHRSPGRQRGSKSALLIVGKSWSI